MDSVKQLYKMLLSSKNAVFFGGAGVSVASGIPDFRSADGIYSQNGVFSPEYILSHDFFKMHTEEFYDFYRKNMIYPNVLPNNTHKVLAKLEKKKMLSAVITQNIDGLHRAAGSNKVYELHGTIHVNFCTKCGKRYGLEAITETKNVPHCNCGGIIKPDVVLYGEQLDPYILEMSHAYATAADMLIVGGTSLSVYPAASLVTNFMGNKLVLINKTPTQADKKADLVIHDDINAVFGELDRML